MKNTVGCGLSSENQLIHDELDRKRTLRGFLAAERPVYNALPYQLDDFGVILVAENADAVRAAAFDERPADLCHAAAGDVKTSQLRLLFEQLGGFPVGDLRILEALDAGHDFDFGVFPPNEIGKSLARAFGRSSCCFRFQSRSK